MSIEERLGVDALTSVKMNFEGDVMETMMNNLPHLIGSNFIPNQRITIRYEELRLSPRKTVY